MCMSISFLAGVALEGLVEELQSQHDSAAANGFLVALSPVFNALGQSFPSLHVCVLKYWFCRRKWRWDIRITYFYISCASDLQGFVHRFLGVLFAFTRFALLFQRRADNERTQESDVDYLPLFPPRPVILEAFLLSLSLGTLLLGVSCCGLDRCPTMLPVYSSLYGRRRSNVAWYLCRFILHHDGIGSVNISGTGLGINGWDDLLIITFFDSIVLRDQGMRLSRSRPRQCWRSSCMRYYGSRSLHRISRFIASSLSLFGDMRFYRSVPRKD